MLLQQISVTKPHQISSAVVVASRLCLVYGANAPYKQARFLGSLRSEADAMIMMKQVRFDFLNNLPYLLDVFAGRRVVSLRRPADERCQAPVALREDTFRRTFGIEW